MIKGFKMKLYEGMEKEYEMRHNQLWPKMKDMIHEHGGKNYTIFLDKETMTLFGYIEIEDEELWAKSADTKINHPPISSSPAPDTPSVNIHISPETCDKRSYYFHNQSLP